MSHARWFYNIRNTSLFVVSVLVAMSRFQLTPLRALAIVPLALLATTVYMSWNNLYAVLVRVARWLGEIFWTWTVDVLRRVFWWLATLVEQYALLPLYEWGVRAGAFDAGQFTLFCCIFYTLVVVIALALSLLVPFPRELFINSRSGRLRAWIFCVPLGVSVILSVGISVTLNQQGYAHSATFMWFSSMAGAALLLWFAYARAFLQDYEDLSAWIEMNMPEAMRKELARAGSAGDAARAASPSRTPRRRD